MKRYRNKDYLKRKMETRKRHRQQNHVYYESNCVICTQPFVHDRMTAMYCSQKCRNKSRTFPVRYLEAMYRKASLTLKRYERTSEAVQEYIKALPIGDSLKEVKEEFKVMGFNETDIHAMDEEILKIKAKKRIEERRSALQKQNPAGFVLDEKTELNEKDSKGNSTDPEMVDFKFDDDEDDVGIEHQDNNNTNNNPQQIEKKYKIRKIGG